MNTISSSDGRSFFRSEALRSCGFGTGSGIRTGRGCWWRFGMLFSAELAAPKSCASWKIRRTCLHLGTNSETSQPENHRGRTNIRTGEVCKRPPLPRPLLQKRRGRSRSAQPSPNLHGVARCARLVLRRPLTWRKRQHEIYSLSAEGDVGNDKGFSLGWARVWRGPSPGRDGRAAGSIVPDGTRLPDRGNPRLKPWAILAHPFGMDGWES